METQPDRARDPAEETSALHPARGSEASHDGSASPMSALTVAASAAAGLGAVAATGAVAGLPGGLLGALAGGITGVALGGAAGAAIGEVAESMGDSSESSA